MILQRFKESQDSGSLIYIGVEFSNYATSGYTCLFTPKYYINCINISVDNQQEGKNNNFKLSDISNTISSSINNILNSDIDIFVETGSSWFYGSELKLPKGCRYNISMKYGSIGWCFPASIGNSFANPTRRTICLTGDGAFQCVMQEISTPLYYNCNHTLILINNNKYQIENVLDNEKYNDLPIFDYEQIFKGMGCKNINTCNISNFEKILRDNYSTPGFNIIILQIDNDEKDNKMQSWARLVGNYTKTYDGINSNVK
jgi:TPP-dependent 2-oxoacid decarboxylase